MCLNLRYIPAFLIRHCNDDDKTLSLSAQLASQLPHKQTHEHMGIYRDVIRSTCFIYFLSLLHSSLHFISLMYIYNVPQYAILSILYNITNLYCKCIHTVILNLCWLAKLRAFALKVRSSNNTHT